MRFLSKKPKYGSFYMKAIAIVVVVVIVAGAYETRFSTIQSRLLSNYSEELYTTIETGPSDQVIYPKSGPFNVQRGYTRIPEFIKTLKSQGYIVKQQSRFSPSLLTLAGHTIMPPYREPSVVGLKINDRSGKVIFDATANARTYQHYSEIPELIVKTLLFLEDRQLAKPAALSTNPVMDWSRFYKAAALYGVGQFGIKMPRQGGSTLATQLEKFRYSPRGKTESAADKLRQIAAASIKVYKDGGDTRGARENIVVDYINSVPLAATPHFGEVHGLGQGLYAWFGSELGSVNRALSSFGLVREKLVAYKQVLTLLASIRAPSYFLRTDQNALQQRVNWLTRVLEEGKVIDGWWGTMLRETSVPLHPFGAARLPVNWAFRKGVNEVRNQLSDSLGIPGRYELNRLSLDTDSSIDAKLQQQVMGIFEHLKSDDFLESNGLKKFRLLDRGDPAKVLYSFLLYQRTPLGNELRVQADNYASSFDINTDMKLDLGSTAKLRTLVHYLEVVHEIYESYRGMDDKAVYQLLNSQLDPITRWTLTTLAKNKNIAIDELLSHALAKKYSADPKERFITGGGVHYFHNFNYKDNVRKISVEEATVRSVNLVFIRLMRDLVKYHSARLTYDADSVLADKKSPIRLAFLEQSAKQEAKVYLRRFYKKYSRKPRQLLIKELLPNRTKSKRHLAILYFAWTKVPSRKGLSGWLTQGSVDSSVESVELLWKAYSKTDLTLSDYGYLLGKHPLEVWVAGQLIQMPELEWSQLLRSSVKARRLSSKWLFETRNNQPQERRLNTRIERDAFSRMAVYWQRLGYPFDRLVPSYATAIGSSADRPGALAELIGIILNKGLRRQDIMIKRLHFAQRTPYHTVLENSGQQGKRVLVEAVANAVYELLQGTVERGTARRTRGAFISSTGRPIVVGGKTGSGDNRIKRVDRRGRLISSIAVNRTATFTFYIGDRFYGVITAVVSGPDSENYRFTSSLPVTILSLLAPFINERL